MPYRWIEDITRADVAFEATGADLPEVFRAAWEAILEVMLPGGTEGAGTRRRRHALTAPDAEALLYALLEWIVYVKDAEGVLMAPVEVAVEGGEGGAVSLSSMSIEVPAQHVRDRLGTDVKAVTMHHFGLVRAEAGWRATVVLDV